MPPSEISTPPPLPHTLSSRLRSTIDPTTGCCKHHPSVQLCELVQGGSRWVVRRKICYKCGSRPQAGGGRHKPGVSVTNPGLSSRARELEKSLEKGSGNREGRERRSRSVSVDRLGSSSRGMDRADRKERHRSESNDRHGSSRRRSLSAARRGSSSAALVTGGPLDKAATNPLAASSHRLESAGRGRRSSRELDREKSSRRASRSKSNDGMESALKELQSQRKEARGRSRSNDALEEAVKRESSHLDQGGSKDHHGAEHKSSSHGRNAAARGSSSSLHSRALEFTQMALEDVAVTPLQDHHEPPKALADRPHTHHNDIQTPNNHHPEANPGAIVQSCPPQLQETPTAEDFNESDPIIMIPTLTLVPGLPPPPPRTSEEMLRHQERLEMRRRSIRREREERRKRRARERKEGEDKAKDSSEDKGNHGAKTRRHRNLSADALAEAPEEPVAPMPSAAALALLDEYDPKETKEEKKHPPTRLDRAKSESHDSVPEPSPEAVALLDANLKRKSERKLANDRRRSSRHQHKKRSHSHDDALTLTSELSFGTAKMYAPPTSNARPGGFNGDHHVRMHPELEGVALPDGPMPSQSSPPMDITVDRSRSLSRSRSARASEDPPSQGRKARDPDSGRRASEAKRGVSRGASRRASSQALVAREPKHERRESNSRALVQAIDAAETHEGGRKISVKDSSTKHRRRSSSRPSRSEEFHKSAPALAASSARSARRGSSKGRVWDATGHEVEAPKNNRAPSRSVERKERSSGHDNRSSRHVDARSYSPSRESRAVKSEGGARRNKGGDKANKHRGGHNKHHSASSKDGRSRLTSSTHPESHSSEEIARNNSHDDYHSSPRQRYEEIEEEAPEPVMIYKKRASSKRLQLQHEEDATDVGYDKPIGAISFHSGDERSHTSSISSSSTIDDASTVGQDEDDDEEEHRRGRARERALHALHGVKGGARKLGTRSRSALGGLKGTRRKWQSALFM